MKQVPVTVRALPAADPPQSGSGASAPQSRRVGILVPSTDTTIEKELRAFVPSSISLHFTRIPLEAVTESGLERMGQSAAEAAKLLAEVRPDLVIYGCTSGTFLKGKRYDEALRDTLEQVTGAPAITMASAVIELLKESAISRLAVYAPYSEELCERLVSFLEEFDVQVEAVSCLGMTDDSAVGRISPEQTAGFVLTNRVTGADGVFISCGNLQAVQELRNLRSALKMPVFSSSLAVIWAICRHLGQEAGMALFDSCLPNSNGESARREPHARLSNGTILRSLATICGTERDVAWGNGQSRRFLLEADGTPISLTDTVVLAGTESRIKYENHFEACYCIAGEGEIEVDGDVFPLRPGVMYSLQQGEHYLRAETEMRLVCAFCPPLRGDEKHDFGAGSYSTY